MEKLIVKVEENCEDSENVKSMLTSSLKESEPSDKSSLDNIESSSSSNEAHDVTTENSDTLNIFVCNSSSTMNETEKSDSFDNVVSNSSPTMNEAHNLTTEKSDSLDNIVGSSSSTMNEAHNLTTEKSDSLDNIVGSSSSTLNEAHNLTTEKSDSLDNSVSSSSTTTNEPHNLTTEIPDSKKKKRKKVSLDKLGLKTGCTAVVALLRENELYVANAGDSRCIVCRNGKVIEMSFDHKPLNEDEYKRIVKAGGSVDNLKGRINNRLNLSRAIGDHRYKQNKDLSNLEQMIIALPDIRTLTINPSEDEFMFLACDGIWNCLSNQEVVDIIRLAIQEGKKKLSQVCEELFDTCLKRVAVGRDNMTAIIVQFNARILKRSTEESKSNETLKTEENRESDAM